MTLPSTATWTNDRFRDLVDLLLDWRCYCFRYDLRVCAGIVGRDLDGWRRDFRILRNGKRRERDDTDERYDDANHAGKNRPVDEKMREVHADRRCSCAVIFRFAIERRFSLCPFRRRATPREPA